MECCVQGGQQTGSVDVINPDAKPDNAEITGEEVPVPKDSPEAEPSQSVGPEKVAGTNIVEVELSCEDNPEAMSCEDNPEATATGGEDEAGDVAADGQLAPTDSMVTNAGLAKKGPADSAATDADLADPAKAPAPKAPPVEAEEVKPSFFMLMEGRDKVWWRLGCLSSMVGGARFPAMAVLMGGSFNDLGSTMATGDSDFDFMASLMDRIMLMVILGVCSGVLKAFSDLCFANLQHQMVTKYQNKYFEILLRKNSGWYDDRGPAVLLSQMTTAVFQISDLFGPDLPSAIMGISAFLLSVVIAISRSWQLGLIMVVALPLMVLATIKGFATFMKMQKFTSGVVGGGALLLEQGISGIKTVAAYGLEDRVLDQIEPWIHMATKVGVPLGYLGGGYFSFRMCLEWSAAALMYYVGSRYVINGDTNVMTGKLWTPGDIFSIWFVQYLGMTQLNLAASYGQTFAEGRNALKLMAAHMSKGNDDIEGPAQGDGPAGSLQVLEDLNLIEFDNVIFRYPTRPESTVLNGLSFKVQKGQRVALVGESGSGKSTIISLLERFYEPESGQIRVNGRDIRELPLNSLRAAIGLVEQEPVLFASSLRKNMGYAAGRGQAIADGAVERMIDRCSMAYVKQLPNGLDTYCGAKGSALSGGQKQRACIARTLLRNPKLLLLDEATAALDNEAEKEIQVTLNAVVSEAGTSITVAHRLSTIRNSDLILVFKEGNIIESGTHDELMAKGSAGMYYGLVRLQEVAEEKEGQGTEGKDAQLNQATVGIARDPSKGGQSDTDDSRKTEDPSRITPRRFWPVTVGIWRSMFGYSKGNTLVCHLGQLGQTAMSVTHPVFALVLISMMTGLYVVDNEKRAENANAASLNLFILGLCQWLFSGMRISCGLACMENYMLSARRDIIRNMMRQDVSFFDSSECTAAKITIIFSALIKEGMMLIRMTLAQIVESVLTLTVTLILAFAKEPRVAGVVLAFWPVNMITKYIEFRDLLKKFTRGKNADAETASAQVFHDCIMYIKSVRAIQCERAMIAEFQELIAQEGFKTWRSMMSTGCIKGVAYSLEMMLYAIAFWWSAQVMQDGGDFEDCMQAMMIIILGLMPVAQFLIAFDSLERKIESGGRVLDLLHCKPTIMEQPKKGEQPTRGKQPALAAPPADVYGKKLAFKNVHFAYATRREIQVLKGITFELSLGKGESVGLCGPSGGGKSSVLTLLMRFADPNSGSISVEGLGDLRSMDVHSWRSTIGYVSQEPMLFQDSLLNNVRYGAPTATAEDVRRVATMAHIDFTADDPVFDSKVPLPPPATLMTGELDTLGISPKQFAKLQESILGKKPPAAPAEAAAQNNRRLSSGGSYNSLCWNDTVRTSTLSGGQKQRVAIARAFLRAPPILIFDEATSALDSNSEKVVQDSLVAFKENRTQFLVAHRLSTIAEADLILVISAGVIAEMGTSNELLKQRGVYYNLVQGALS